MECNGPNLAENVVIANDARIAVSTALRDQDRSDQYSSNASTSIGTRPDPTRPHSYELAKNDPSVQREYCCCACMHAPRALFVITPTTYHFACCFRNIFFLKGFVVRKINNCATDAVFCVRRFSIDTTKDNKRHNSKASYFC